MCGVLPLFLMKVFGYYLLIVDDFSRYSWIFPMKQKSEVFGIFVQFKSKVENMLNCTIKTIQCDEGGEYKSHAFQPISCSSWYITTIFMS